MDLLRVVPGLNLLPSVVRFSPITAGSLYQPRPGPAFESVLPNILSIANFSDVPPLLVASPMP